MKNFGSGRPHRLRQIIAALFFLVLLLGVFSISTALGASGGEGGSKGWVSTDTFRVMNFVVLAIVLVYLLRKP